MVGTGDAELNRHLSEAIRQMERLNALESQLEDLHGEGLAADGLVHVTVGAGGHLVGLELDPRALRLGSTALAEAIIEASTLAANQLAEKANELVGPLGDEDLNLGEMLAGELPKLPTAQQLADDVAAVDRAESPADVIRMLRSMRDG